MITILCGKSASGKDTLARALKDKGFIPVISTTSRPMRKGEVQGRDYNFITKEEFVSRIDNDEFIEFRTYDTMVNGIKDTWYYGLPKGTIDTLSSRNNYVVILDVEGANNLARYLDNQYNVILIFVDSPTEVRTQRAMKRGSFDITEWNRRVQDDDIKFSGEALRNSIVKYKASIVNDEDTKLDSLVNEFIFLFNSISRQMYKDKLYR